MPIQPVPHPAKGLLARLRITNREVGKTLGFSDHYVGRVLNGWQPASKRFRQGLAELVNVPESELFLDEELAASAEALLQRTRVARGLPLTVEQPAVLAQVAGMVRAVGG